MRALLASLLVLVSAAALAQGHDYPSHAVRVIVPLTAGGNLDIVARTVAEQISKSLGQPVVVENRPGASTRIAVQALKASEPNGQTLLVAPDAIVTLFPHVFRGRV